MLNNSSLQKWVRLEKKSLDSQFMNEIISGLNSSPFEAKAVLDTVHKVYGDFFETSETLAPGKAKFIVISAEDSPAKSLKEAKKVKPEAYTIAENAIGVLDKINYNDKLDYNSALAKIIKIFVPDPGYCDKIIPLLLIKKNGVWILRW